MSEEKRLMIENDLCMNKSKAQVIKLYLDLMEQYNKEIDKLTAESTEWEERTYCWQDRAENLQIVLDKIKEYLTSYESINTIQECEIPENNIELDEETFIEMVNRYMKVHDKILELLEEIE